MKKLLFFYITISFTVLWADIFVVTSKKASIVKLNKNDVERLFLNKTRLLPNGQKVKVVECASCEVKSSFYSMVTRKSKSQLRSYWAKQIFTGKGKPPRQIKKEKLLSYLDQNPNTISYITAEQMTDSLKVLYKIKR